MFEMFEYSDNVSMLITKNDIKLFVLRENQENFMKEVWIKLGFERECVAFLEVGIGWKKRIVLNEHFFLKTCKYRYIYI